MAEKIDVTKLKKDTYSAKTVKDFTVALADPEASLAIGSTAALVAAMSAAAAEAAVKKTGLDLPEMAKAAETLETMRSYFVHLIDEEIKAKDPLANRLAKQSTDAEIEAGYRTACIIIDEIIYSVGKVLELLDSVKDKLCPCTFVEANAAVSYAQTAMDSVRLQKAFYSTKMNEEVYARTTRREPELVIEQYKPMVQALTAAFEIK